MRDDSNFSLSLYHPFISELSCWISGFDSIRCPDPMLINETFISVMYQSHWCECDFLCAAKLVGNLHILL